MTDDWLQKSPVYLLHRALQCANFAFQQEKGKGELTTRQYAVLLTVAANEGLSQTSLTERIGMDRSTVAATLRRMEEKGLVKRHSSQRDKRTNAIKLTAKGQRILQSAKPIMRRAAARVLGAVPKQNQQLFLRDLKLIVNTLSDRNPGPP